MQLAEEVFRGTLKYIINGDLAYVRLDSGDGGASYVEMRSQPLINAGVGIGDVFELHMHVINLCDRTLQLRNHVLPE